MARYLTEKQMAIWKFCANLSELANIKTALARCACFRQAAIDRTTLDSFAMVLVQEDLRAFQVSMAIISETKREPGETAFPDLGSILSMIKRCQESWSRSRRDPPADREPVYASRPVRLRGDRLKAAVEAEIHAIENEAFAAKRGSIEVGLACLDEKRQTLYRELCEQSEDWEAYARKKQLSAPLQIRAVERKEPAA